MTDPLKASNSLLHSETLRQVLGADVMQILRCGICMDFFQVPIVLPCGHTFCLHCLTQMCNHASKNHAPGSAKDVRIGCPKCRVLIYVTPILRRNVTCNFIIQSLIESLKVREDRGSARQSQGVNTECSGDGRGANHHPTLSTLSSSSSFNQATSSPANDVSTVNMLSEFDWLTNAIIAAKPSIVDRAFMEIEEIRSDHLTREKQRQADRDAKTRDQVRAVQNIMKKSREEQHHNHQSHHQNQQVQQNQQRQPPQRQILTRPQQLQQPQTTKNHNLVQLTLQPRVENFNELLQNAIPFLTQPPFMNHLGDGKNAFSKQQIQEKTQVHPPSKQPNFQQCVPQQQSLANSRSSSQQPNYSLQQRAHFSVHEPPPKCRKLASAAAAAHWQLPVKQQQEKLRQDADGKDKKVLGSINNMAENKPIPISSSTSPDDGAAGEGMLLLATETKFPSACDGVRLNNDPAIMSFSLTLSNQ